MSYILGIDLGTTAIKAAVFDDKGKECGSKTVEYTPDTPHPGYAELDAQVYVDTFISAAKSAMERAAVTPDEIVSLGMSAQGETTICLDENNHPLRPLYGWTSGQPKRPSILRRRLAEKRSRSIPVSPAWTRSGLQQKFCGLKRMSLRHMKRHVNMYS